MPLKLPNVRPPVDPRIAAFLQRILGKQGGKGALDALTSLSLAPTPMGAIKAPELSAEATAGLSDEELDILGDLLGTGGKGAPAGVSKKAATRYARTAEQLGGQPGGAKALEAAKAQATAAGQPIETEVPKLLKKHGSGAAESTQGSAIHDLLGRLRESDKHLRDLQLQHARELSERLGLPLQDVLSMLRNPSRD